MAETKPQGLEPVRLRFTTPPAAGSTMQVQHRVAITDSNGGSPCVSHANIDIDYNDSGLLQANVTLDVAALDIDLECVVGEIRTEWQGKTYRLIEVTE